MSYKILLTILICSVCLSMSGCDSGEKARAKELELEILKIRESAKVEMELAAERLRLEELRKEAEIRRIREAELENEHRKQEANRLAESAKNAIISKKYQGGQNKGVTVQEWSYDKSNDRYLIKVNLNWDGVFFSSNHYSADGTISVRSDGTDTTWNPTWVNDTLKDYQETRNIVGGVVAIGVIGAAASSGQTQDSASANSGVPIIIDNTCHRPIKIAIHFKDAITNSWKSAGWFNFTGGERSGLNSQGQSVRTKNATMYFYAATTDGSNLVWQGEQKEYLNGNLVNFKEYVDNTNDKTILTISCSR